MNSHLPKNSRVPEVRTNVYQRLRFWGTKLSSTTYSGVRLRFYNKYSEILFSYFDHQINSDTNATLFESPNIELLESGKKLSVVSF